MSDSSGNERDNRPGFFGDAFDIDHDGHLDANERANDTAQYAELMRQRQEENNTGGGGFSGGGGSGGGGGGFSAGEYDYSGNGCAIIVSLIFTAIMLAILGFFIENPFWILIVAASGFLIWLIWAGYTGKLSEVRRKWRETFRASRKIRGAMVILVPVLVLCLLLAIPLTRAYLTGPIAWHQKAGGSNFTMYDAAGLKVYVPASWQAAHPLPEEAPAGADDTDAGITYLDEGEYYSCSWNLYTGDAGKYASVTVCIKDSAYGPGAAGDRVSAKGFGEAYRNIQYLNDTGEAGALYADQAAFTGNLCVEVYVTGTRGFLPRKTAEEILDRIDYSGFNPKQWE